MESPSAGAESKTFLQGILQQQQTNSRALHSLQSSPALCPRWTVLKLVYNYCPALHNTH
ncbi:hypothetical protein DPMN_068537 [Dreissena polymorpha]|uniref:Uncharacterized protein n=1 Tax=Dreissena polymorpha TaxID=45954 RepID=A0A9D3Z2F4_DREPO|nr:hypothetical protein DPMN_068537 [Dreissena polymorpha]